MIKHQEIYLPDGETHLTDWMTRSGEMVDGKGTYQITKLRAALKYVVQFRSAIDVGAHVGMWTMQLKKKFQWVHAFEPVAAHRECFEANMQGATNFDLYPVALGDKEGSVSIHTAPTSSGDSWVKGEGDIPLKTLDSYNLHSIDFIKLDCEGYELFALHGGEKTIKTWKPVIIVEQKPGRAQKFGLPETGAVSYLKTLGYTLKQELSGDFIMVPV